MSTNERPVVLVTEAEYRKAKQIFRDAAATGLDCRPASTDEFDLAAAVRSAGARHVIVGVQRYAGPLYAALPRGGVIARFGVGHDGIDKAQATAAGLLCANTPGVLDDSVAEHAVALMLAAARHVPALDAAMRAGTWAGLLGTELRGRTLALVGCGAIGRNVARITVRGFGMRVTGCDSASVDQASMRRDFGFQRVVPDFVAAVADADFVSLHLPATPATHHFLNAERLAAIPNTAWLINTARGAVMDECALYDALAAGRLAGAALDVFESEPYAPVDPSRDLRTLPNVILTPHVASATAAACARIAARALRNIRLAEAGAREEMDLIGGAGPAPKRGNRNEPPCRIPHRTTGVTDAP
jgi:phosphoglycerate dehydrogenase-like enzyme